MSGSTEGGGGAGRYLIEPHRALADGIGVGRSYISSDIGMEDTVVAGLGG